MLYPGGAVVGAGASGTTSHSVTWSSSPSTFRSSRSPSPTTPSPPTGQRSRRPGSTLKRGILLYGWPGTGKTHTVRHLLSQSEGSTAIILSGGSLARELVRRAVVAAALQDLPVSDSHLSAAVDDLMADAETLTRSLLGSGSEAAAEPGPGPGFPGNGLL